MRKVVHIQSSCSYVCCNKQLDCVLSELLHSQVSLLLTEVTVQRFCVIAVLNQLICYLLRFYFCTAENNSVDVWIEVCDALKGKIFVLCIHKVVDMIDVFCTLIA